MSLSISIMWGFNPSLIKTFKHDTIVNDGIQVKPTLLISKPNPLNDRIFSSETSKKMKSIMNQKNQKMLL